MSIIKTKQSQAIIKVLQECNGRSLPVRALATYVNGRIGVPTTFDDIRTHVADLVLRGYVEHIVASPLNPADLEYRITELGMEVPVPSNI